MDLDLLNLDLLNKQELLTYMRNKASKTLDQLLGNSKLKKQDKTKEMNEILEDIRDSLFAKLNATCKNDEKYPGLTAGAFMIYYCWIIVSLEYRNYLWNYESMDLSRRSGELWESLLKQCWTYPVNKTIRRFEAPNFVNVAEQIKNAFKQKLIDKNIEKEVLQEIFTDYSKIWSLLGDSVNLSSDELFETTFKELTEENINEAEYEDKKYIIDFKGSYGSNEKGNKERLLTVARVYDLLNYYKLTDKPYKCILAVRTVEDKGHNYLRQLEKSGLWTVKRGKEVYEMVHTYTGFDVLSFIKEKELSIIDDLDETTAKYMKSKITSRQGKTFADHYLTWW